MTDKTPPPVRNFATELIALCHKYGMTPPVFEYGKPVSKVGGDYRFDGWVGGYTWKRSGQIRYSIEDDRGIIHIFNERQIDVLRPREWQPISTAPDGVVVETKVDDSKGVRNEQDLKRSGDMWWLPNGSMYVYYTPTHWRPK